MSAERNFPEEAPQENGNYQNTCQKCGEVFIGNKHRLFCKVCQSGLDELKMALEHGRKVAAWASIATQRGMGSRHVVVLTQAYDQLWEQHKNLIEEVMRLRECMREDGMRAPDLEKIAGAPVSALKAVVGPARTFNPKGK